ncbi:ABC transporter permease [Pseudarthrobacter sulfonivorans]|uniref:ABC transporter permease n=1 Tax=Pseudarthrobacter sulfonivorans TaxID=121292 RepID=UPI0028628382|nr:ABC transporter permease [Pseudarthrobacter sulfonivorans]MDR6413837.1 ABC-2 type transport system permease protein [Pseudarthrobacter sulfonivorans]
MTKGQTSPARQEHGRELVSPGKGNGLADVFRSRFLLKLLVRKELRVRYRGSVLGLLWTYVKPGVQFVAFYIALGVFLGLEQSASNRGGLPNYAVYLFSGIILVNFFTESLSNSTRSIVHNSGLINKIYLPRELFPAASVWVSGVHFLPQIFVLVVACLFSGWRPGPLEALSAVAGFLIIALLAVGLGLFFGAVNVYFRDAENVVDLFLMVATWVSPVLYSWRMVQDKAGEIGFAIYQLNPITVAVECFHHAFWLPTTAGAEGSPPNLLTVWVPVALIVSLVILFLGQWTFRRLEGRFAQEL